MATLSDLKTLVRQARERDAPAAPAPAPVVAAATRTADARRRTAATEHADADVDIAQEFSDVTPLASRNAAARTRVRPAPIAQRRIDDERDALEMSKYGAEPSPQSWDIGQELEGAQTYLRQGLGTDVLTKLRRGYWAVQCELDLHRLTADEAHDALADFLVDARHRGMRCVRVIHGKGLSSPNREPVLKGRVRRWLSHWDEVLAYCEAPRHAGGSGAVVVLLRGS